MRQLLVGLAVVASRDGRRGRAAAGAHEREASRRAPAAAGLLGRARPALAAGSGPAWLGWCGADDRPRAPPAAGPATDSGGASCAAAAWRGERRSDVVGRSDELR